MPAPTHAANCELGDRSGSEEVIFGFESFHRIRFKCSFVGVIARPWQVVVCFEVNYRVQRFSVWKFKEGISPGFLPTVYSWRATQTIAGGVVWRSE